MSCIAWLLLKLPLIDVASARRWTLILRRKGSSSRWRAAPRGDGTLLGPPPKSFLERSEKCNKYWDNEGEDPSSVEIELHSKSRRSTFWHQTTRNWKGSVPIPEQSFESRELLLDETSKTAFIRFLRRTIRWVPEERPIAEDLAFDEFLMQCQ